MASDSSSIKMDVEIFEENVVSIESYATQIIDASDTTDVEADTAATQNSTAPVYVEADARMEAILRSLQTEVNQNVVTLRKIEQNYKDVDEAANTSMTEVSTNRSAGFQQ